MLNQPNILVATDFSDFSLMALKAGEEIRRKSNGRLQLVHVTNYPEQWDWFTNDVVINYYPEAFKKDLLQEIRRRMEEQMKAAEAVGSTEILMGPPYRTLLEYSKKSFANIIVMGHRGKEGHFHLGGLAAKLISSSDCPVLVVNRPFTTGKIAGLVDASRPEKNIFPATEQLGFIFSSEIDFVSVWPDQTTYVEYGYPDEFHVHKMDAARRAEVIAKMEKTLAMGIDPHSKARVITSIASETSVSDSLVKILDDSAIDLAVMTRHQKGRLEKILLGSVTRGVLEKWKGNFFVIPPAS